jgi:hypothetical protein
MVCLGLPFSALGPRLLDVGLRERGVASTLRNKPELNGVYLVAVRRRWAKDPRRAGEPLSNRLGIIAGIPAEPGD